MTGGGGTWTKGRVGGGAENINKHDNRQYIAQLYQTNTVTNITNI